MKVSSLTKKPIIRIMIILLFFTVASIIVTYPAIVRLDTHIIGFLFDGRGDLPNTIHIHWWVSKQVGYAFFESFPNPFSFSALVRKIPFTMGIWNILDIFMFVIPLRTFFSFPAYYNIEIILILIFNGFAGFLLVRQLTGSHFFGVAGGVFSSFMPFTLHEISLGRPIQGSTFFISLYLLFLIRFFKNEKLPDAVMTGLIWLMAGLFYWFNLIFMGFIFIVLLFFHGFIEKKTLKWKYVMLILAVAFAGSLFAVGGFATRGFLAPNWEIRFFQSFPSYEDIQALGIPDFGAMEPMNPALIVARSVPLFSFLNPGGLFPMMLIPVSTFFFILNRKKNTGLFVISMFFFVLSLGPYLKIGSMVHDFSMPYKFFYKYLPFFSRFYFPYHLVPYVVIPLSAYVLVQSQEYLKKLSWAKRFFILAIVIVSSIGSLYLRGYLPLPLRPVMVSDFYKNTESLPPGGFIVLPYPGEKMAVTDFFQIYHQRLIWRNHVARPPYFGEENLYPRMKDEEDGGNSFLDFLNSVRQASPNDGFLTVDALRIKELGFEWIVLHRYYLENTQMPFPQFQDTYDILEGRFGEPYYEDEMIAVFRM